MNDFSDLCICTCELMEAKTKQADQIYGSKGKIERT